MTAFTAYGSFWLSLVGPATFAPRLGLAGNTPEERVLGVYRLAVGRLHLFMFFGTLGANRVLQFKRSPAWRCLFLAAVGASPATTRCELLQLWGIICGASLSR